MDWKTVEVLGYSYYVERGWRVCVPVVIASEYDFIVEQCGTFKRVNVKMAGRNDKNHSNIWRIHQTGHYSAQKNARVVVDVFLAYIPDEVPYFIELPGDFFTDSKSKSKAIPQRFLRQHPNG